MMKHVILILCPFDHVSLAASVRRSGSASRLTKKDIHFLHILTRIFRGAFGSSSRGTGCPSGETGPGQSEELYAQAYALHSGCTVANWKHVVIDSERETEAKGYDPDIEQEKGLPRTKRGGTCHAPNNSCSTTRCTIL